MEPHEIETAVKSSDEGQASPPRQSETKRRFQIVKLEERIAPGGNKNTNNGCGHGQCFCGH
jgi:hypothetical protein